MWRGETEAERQSFLFWSGLWLRQGLNRGPPDSRLIHLHHNPNLYQYRQDTWPALYIMQVKSRLEVTSGKGIFFPKIPCWIPTCPLGLLGSVSPILFPAKALSFPVLPSSDQETPLLTYTLPSCYPLPPSAPPGTLVPVLAGVETRSGTSKPAHFFAPVLLPLESVEISINNVFAILGSNIKKPWATWELPSKPAPQPPEAM